MAPYSFLTADGDEAFTPFEFDYLAILKSALMWSVSLLPTLLVLSCYSLEAYARPLASVLHLRSESEDESDVPTWAIAAIAVGKYICTVSSVSL